MYFVVIIIIATTEDLRGTSQVYTETPSHPKVSDISLIYFNVVISLLRAHFFGEL